MKGPQQRDSKRHEQAELAWYRAREKFVRRVLNSRESFPDDYYAAKALDEWEAENPKP